MNTKKNSKSPTPCEEGRKTHPRLPRPKETELGLLSEEDLEYADKALYRAGECIGKILEETGWKHTQLLNHLNSKFFPARNTLSRILNHDRKRPITCGQLFDLRRATGISLDKLADGDHPLEYEDLSTSDLLVRMDLIIAELRKRTK